jgi:hypothetical protein
MVNKKKHWNTPELTVLIRGDHEEAVLAACKYNVPAAPAPNKQGCTVLITGGECRLCYRISPS